jgi:hypothetical protein
MENKRSDELFKDAQQPDTHVFLSLLESSWTSDCVGRISVFGVFLPFLPPFFVSDGLPLGDLGDLVRGDLGDFGGLVSLNVDWSNEPALMFSWPSGFGKSSGFRNFSRVMVIISTIQSEKPIQALTSIKGNLGYSRGISSGTGACKHL